MRGKKISVQDIVHIVTAEENPLVYLWVIERFQLFKDSFNIRYLDDLAVQISGWTNALPDMVISHLFGKVRMFRRFL